MFVPMRYTVFDIFSGCGGMSWGLHKAGFEIVGALDNWKVALNTFSINHPNAKVFCGDIREFDIASVRKELGFERGALDCLVGGPPCQGFSKNVPSSYRFFEDPRNQLFNDYLNFVEEFLPKVVVMENVAEIYNAFNGTVRKQIVERLESLGYEVEVEVLFGPDYGIPQRRSRCFFFATRTGFKPYFPAKTHAKSSKKDLFGLVPKYVSAWDAISDLPVLENGEGALEMEYDGKPVNDFQQFIRGDNEILRDHITRELKGIQIERMRSISAGQGIKDLPEEIRPKGGYSGAYGRLDFENVAPTITRWVFHPGSGRYGHPQNDRLITIREAARIQCFTDDFQFSGTYIEKAHQIGNAVPSLFMYRLAEPINEALKFVDLVGQLSRSVRIASVQTSKKNNSR
jgi:DNA (cytosine-5)-methyltransferase 1